MGFETLYYLHRNLPKYASGFDVICDCLSLCITFHISPLSFSCPQIMSMIRDRIYCGHPLAGGLRHPGNTRGSTLPAEIQKIDRNACKTFRSGNFLPN
jgi:hypothetical protein